MDTDLHPATTTVVDAQAAVSWAAVAAGAVAATALALVLIAFGGTWPFSRVTLER